MSRAGKRSAAASRLGDCASWQPIEIAPKNKRILLFFPLAKRIEGGSWDDNRYARTPRPFWSGDGEKLWGVQRYRDDQPTHWMPLPEPPPEPPEQENANENHD